MIDILCVLADGRWKIKGRKVRPFSLVWFLLVGAEFLGYGLFVGALGALVYLMSYIFKMI